MRDRNHADATERVRRDYDAVAPRYDRILSVFERLLFGDGREWVCARAYGATLEVAIGTGRNLGLYGADVDLTGVELSPRMLEVARRRAADTGRKAELMIGDAQALEFAGATFDTVVMTLALCTIPDHRAALREAHRVLRLGGRIVLLEHVRSTVAPVAGAQRLIDWLPWPATDHLARDPLDHFGDVGFAVEQLQRTKLGVVERVMAVRS